MRLTTTLLALLGAITLYSQDVVIEWDNTLNDVSTELEKTILLGENRAIIIPKTMEKPIGLKPFLYTYDPKTKKMNCEPIPDWKNMETYKEFFTSGNNYVGDENNIYRVHCEFGKRKKDIQPYSLTIDELNDKSLRPTGTPVLNIPEGTTEAYGSMSAFLNDDFLAVVLGHNKFAANLPGRSNRTIEVFVYARKDFKLVYNRKHVIGTSAKLTQIGDVELNQNGEIHLTVIEHQTELKSMADAKLMNASPNSLNYVAFSKDGIDEEIFSEDVTNLVSTCVELPDNSNIGIGFSKSSPLKNGGFKIHTIKWQEGGRTKNSAELSFSDLLNQEKASYSQNFLNKIDKSDQLFVNVRSSDYTIDNDGNAILLFDFQITAEKGMGISNTLFACFIAKIAPDGSIIWVNAIPAIGGLSMYGVDYAALADNEGNIHVLSNGILEEYPDGQYDPNLNVEVNADFGPVQISINGEDGKITSNKIRKEGFSDGEGFSPHEFLKLANSVYLVGMNKKGRLVNTSISEDLGVTFGVLQIK